jgi:flavin reductase (DIM6/NTAB) family NADH-FMN oxidoreductase RutF
LNVPTQSLSETLLKIGKETGETVDKFKLFEGEITKCGVGWGKQEKEQKAFAVEECVAHMFCIMFVFNFLISKEIK